MQDQQRDKPDNSTRKGAPFSVAGASTMPGARDQDVLSFLAEWFDPLPQLTKQYILKYFVDTNEAEMVELKTRRLFLKRSPCPSHLTVKDFAVGSKVILYGRDLTIAAYADKPTETSLTPDTESAVFLIGPEMQSSVGKILDGLLCSTRGVLSKLKMARLDPLIAAEAAKCLGLQGKESRDAADGLSGGPVVLGVIRGSNARDLAAKACAGLASQFGAGGAQRGVWCCASGQHAEDLERMFTPGGPVGRCKGSRTATFDSCSCCVIKPHAVKAGSAGKIIDHIIAQGFDVSAMETFQLTRTQAREFFEVYQGVIPRYGEVLDEMATGACVALEVRGENAVNAFRETAGPWDVDMAKELRPNSIRGKFGESGAQTGVHCTDLPEDGPLESRYFFELMQGV